jgi:hypothetical protein
MTIGGQAVRKEEECDGSNSSKERKSNIHIHSHTRIAKNVLFYSKGGYGTRKILT